RSQREHAFWAIQKRALDNCLRRVQSTSRKAYHKDQLCQKYQRLKLRHYVFSQLIGRTGMRWDSVTNIVTGSAATWAQVVAVSVIAPNSDEEQELDATFLTHGVHVNVEPYSPNDVEEIEAPVAGQCSKHVGKQPSHFETSAGKKRKGQPIEYITDAVMEFIDMSRKRRSDKDSDSRKTTVESTPVGDRFSMD
ncbi:hypothetical protein CFP56_032820, partial [Quercus suber]